MYKKALIRRVSELLRINNVRKQVSMPRHVFHISDDEGNVRDLVIKKADKAVLFTVDDIEVVLDFCLAAIAEALKNGEKVVFRDFGTFSLKKRLGRVQNDNYGNQIVVPDHYIPKFTPGAALKEMGKMYAANNVDEYSEDFDDEDGE